MIVSFFFTVIFLFIYLFITFWFALSFFFPYIFSFCLLDFLFIIIFFFYLMFYLSNVTWGIKSKLVNSTDLLRPFSDIKRLRHRRNINAPDIYESHSHTSLKNFHHVLAQLIFYTNRYINTYFSFLIRVNYHVPLIIKQKPTYFLFDS